MASSTLAAPIAAIISAAEPPYDAWCYAMVTFHQTELLMGMRANN
jgi:hypothetical protein